MLDILKNILERDHLLDVQTCLCPVTAYQYLQHYCPDMIISDYEMPRMNGVELFFGIRSLGIKVPLILYTSYTQEEIEEELFQMDSVYYVHKMGYIVKDIAKMKRIIQHSFGDTGKKSHLT